MSIDIYFDGGSHNNQSSSLGQGFRSFVTFYNGKQVPMTIDRGTKDEKRVTQAHLDWGQATNNEAEWKTFMAALWYASRTGLEPAACFE